MSSKLFPVYTASIFFTIHYAATLYINSSYLGGFFSPVEVSALYIVASLCSIAMFMHGPELLGRFGYRRFLLIVSTLLFAAASTLATTTSALMVALAFILYGSVYLLVYFILDVNMEELTDKKVTGSVRGLYLTFINTAIAIAPLMVAVISSNRSLSHVYAFSLIFLIPVFLIGATHISNRIPDKHISHSLPFNLWKQAVYVRRVTITRFILELFYAVMVIYTPLYLYNTLGFDWSEIGVMFFIMLLPFVLLEWPAGVLADKLFGEKEMMSLGLFLAGTALLIMPFLGKNFLAWTAALFLSRVGASLVEITTESYFFKHVDARDTEFISIFRISRPAATVAGAFLGGLVSLFLPLSMLFFVLAIIVFIGLRQTVMLEDTL